MLRIIHIISLWSFKYPHTQTRIQIHTHTESHKHTHPQALWKTSDIRIHKSIFSFSLSATVFCEQYKVIFSPLALEPDIIEVDWENLQPLTENKSHKNNTNSMSSSHHTLF